MTDTGEGAASPSHLEARDAIRPRVPRRGRPGDPAARNPDLLLRCSILDRFSASLLDALSGDPDGPSHGEEWLGALKRGNLFITALDAEGEWCRLHQLFRDALRRRLLAVHGAAYPVELHRRASDWFTERGLVHEAIQHALASGDTHHAAEIVAEHLQPFLDREADPDELDGWLRLLPTEVTDNCPARCWPAPGCWCSATGPATLRRCWSVSGRSWTRTARSTRRSAMRCTASSTFSGATPGPSPPTPSGCWRAASPPFGASRRTGTPCAATPRTARRRPRDGRPRRRGPRLAERPPFQRHPRGRSQLGMVLRADARLHFLELRLGELGRASRELMTLGQAHGLQTTSTWGHFFAGLTSYYWNELDDARHHLFAAANGHAVADAGIALDSVLALAMTQQALGDVDGASDTLAETAGLLLDVENEGSLRLLRSFQARLAIDAGDLDAAGRQPGCCAATDRPPSSRSSRSRSSRAPAGCSSRAPRSRSTRSPRWSMESAPSRRAGTMR